MLTSLINQHTRPTDLAGRRRNQSFLLAVPEAGVTSAAIVAERIRRVVETWNWEVIAPGLRVTVSAGVAAARPGDSVRALLGRAEAQLSLARALSPNRVSFETRLGSAAA